MKTTVTVLVTGGSGFLAGWIIIKLLNQGCRVHATVQNISDEASIRDSLVKGGAPRASDPDILSFYQTQLELDDGWNEAIDGCDYVIHTASPFPPVQPKNESEIIIPARDGALRVLQAALSAGVKRVVMTSSASAIEYTNQPLPSLITEEYWTDITRRDITPYIRSKTIAEQAAWDFMHEHGGSMSLTTIAPGTMLGPILGRHISFSVHSIKQLLDGSAPAIPQLGFGFVDVRDVAELHIKAMTTPKAANERFLAGGSFLWLSDIAHILKARLPELSTKVPTRVLPNLLSHFLALFNPSLRSVINDLGKVHNYSPAKAERLLGWHMRPIEETVIDTAQSLT